MQTLTDIDELKTLIGSIKHRGRSIGFVPTMGFLHEGHLSLVREALASTDTTVVSIFVNPSQFGPEEDFQSYPRDIDRDSAMLKAIGIDILFTPQDTQMYPAGFRTTVQVEGLQDRLLGRSRPGHFKGVCTVVLKLFNIVQPDVAFFGQKDAQQAVILKKMARDLNLSVGLEVLPIVREEDGLALSSRNRYLNPEEREAARILSISLRKARKWIEEGERGTEIIVEKIKKSVRSEPLARIDYVEIVDSTNLEPLATIRDRALIDMGVYIGKTRLIDNAVIRLEESVHE